jgi:hypothetical protein
MVLRGKERKGGQQQKRDNRSLRMVCEKHYIKRVKIFFCSFEGSLPPLWSSGQSSWLQIQSPGFDFGRYEIF